MVEDMMENRMKTMEITSLSIVVVLCITLSTFVFYLLLQFTTKLTVSRPNETPNSTSFDNPGYDNSPEQVEMS